MMASVEPVTEREIVSGLLDVFRAHAHFVVTAHANPDGDAVGSVLGMTGLLEQLGASVEMVLADPVPAIYRTLPGAERIRRSATLLSPDAPAILLECDIARCGLQGLEGRLIVNIDHHASARAFGDLNWIDHGACAVGAMICRLVAAARESDPSIRMTQAMATALYTAILTDTGSFTYAATDAETFQLARELTEAGASPSGIARAIYASNPFSKMRLLGTALRNLRREGPFAWTMVTQAEFAEAESCPAECDGIVNYLIGIDGIEAAFFLREAGDGCGSRVSLRSRGAVDVAELAEELGGGGHRVASGCTLPEPLAEAGERILAKLRERMPQAG
jgi:phosphoesterase RecJ-like protein